MIGTQQPRALPTFRWRPDLVSGIPIERESFALALDKPMARFQEKDRPGILNLLDMFLIRAFSGLQWYFPHIVGYIHLACHTIPQKFLVSCLFFVAHHRLAWGDLQ